MKMELVRDDDRDGKENFGKKGAKIEGPESWRFAFPCKGCLARPIDSEACNRIEKEFSIVDPRTRARLQDAMKLAGTLPVPSEPVRVKPSEPSEAELEKLTDPKKK